MGRADRGHRPAGRPHLLRDRARHQGVAGDEARRDRTSSRARSGTPAAATPSRSPPTASPTRRARPTAPGRSSSAPCSPPSSPSSSPCPSPSAAPWRSPSGCPGGSPDPSAFTLELLAGIPSVIIGLWGVFTLGPILAEHVYPHIADPMPDVPVFDWFGPRRATGRASSPPGIILALMIIPIIAATTRELFRQVPAAPQGGGLRPRA